MTVCDDVKFELKLLMKRDYNMAFGLDAKLPLIKDATFGFYGLTTTIKENTMQKVKMLMLTAPGERMMLPEYGVGLRNYLFENAPEMDIVNAINEQVDAFLPEIKIVLLKVKRGDAAHTGQRNNLFVELTYLIKSINLKDVLKLVETVEGVGM